MAASKRKLSASTNGTSTSFAEYSTATAMASDSGSWRGGPPRGAFGGVGGGRGRGRGATAGTTRKAKPVPTPAAQNSKKKAKVQKQAEVLPAPFHDQRFVDEEWSAWGGKGPPKPQWKNDAKSIVANYVSALDGSKPKYEAKEGHVDGVPMPSHQTLFRVTVVVDQGNNVVGVGDHKNRKEAEKLAALSACYQLGGRGLFNKSNLPLGPAVNKPAAGPSSAPQAAASQSKQGSGVTLERARTYMQFYCQRFNFGKPDLKYSSGKGSGKEKGQASWQATLLVGGSKIGMGSGRSKKMAHDDAMLDTVRYLQECDPQLWSMFVEQESTTKGKGSGDVAEVLFHMSSQLDDDLRDIVYDARESSLYRRAKLMLEREKTEKDAPSATPQSNAYRGPRGASEEALRRKNADLADRLSDYQTDDTPKVVRLREQRASLPVTSHASLVLSAIETNPVTVLMAATGSGKTTQVPQLILDSKIMRGQGAKCNIICTQPRRIAAISVAQRIAEERNERLGQSVGYQVRFEANPPQPDGSMLFCTTGVFLRRLQNDMESADGRFLDPVTHIVVDEVHERDIETDLLLFCLRKVLADRKAAGKPEIKVLLMSATVDPTLFQQYFPDPKTRKPTPVISVPGRSFPVEKFFLESVYKELQSRHIQPHTGGWVWNEDKVQKYLRRELHETIELDPATGKVLRDNDDLDIPYPLVALTIAHVLRKSDDGHVLVFLPGWDEIKGVQNILADPHKFPLLGLNFNDTRRFEVHVLHSTIPVKDQQLVFSPPSEGVRRIILSTNIAETSVTIPDVVYVVDTGKIKEKRFDPQRHLSSLVTAWVGTSNLNQRAGRAGRHRPGEYYGILSKRRYDILHTHSTVEMKRTDLSNIVMHVKTLNFPGMEVEDVLDACIEPPERERVAAALRHLQTIGALDRFKDLTALGRVLSQLPVEAQIGKLCLFGSFFRCLEPVLSLAAILTNRDPFLAPIHAKEEADRIKSGWAPYAFRSDILASLRAFTEWYEMQRRGEYGRANGFAHDNFLSKPTLLQIAQVKEHLLSSLDRAGILDVSAGGTAAKVNVPGRGRGRVGGIEIPSELNANAESLPLLAALIAVAVAPNFAVRKSQKMLMATKNDKTCHINASSVNSARKSKGEDIPLQNERQIFAFGEKSLSLPRPGEKGPGHMTLRSTTRLDPLGFMLFGARNLGLHNRGIECDDWLPVVGNVGALDDVERLKWVLDASLLRVFAGLQAAIVEKGVRRKRGYREPSVIEIDDTDEHEDEDDDEVRARDKRALDQPLSDQEVKELDKLTGDVVDLLNRYMQERLDQDASQQGSRMPSRPQSRIGTPMGYATPGASRPGSSMGFRGMLAGRGGPSSGAMSRVASQQGGYG